MITIFPAYCFGHVHFEFYLKGVSGLSGERRGKFTQKKGGRCSGGGEGCLGGCCQYLQLKIKNELVCILIKKFY